MGDLRRPRRCSARFAPEDWTVAAADAGNRLIADELALFDTLVPLRSARILEAGCGAAHLARELLRRHAHAEGVGIGVEERQLARNLALPQQRLRFERTGSEAVPSRGASFDGALMLKSLHPVPVELMDRALGEVRRVLRPGGWLYVSEPVHAGALNELIRIFNDEDRVRAAAQAALDRAPACGVAAGGRAALFDAGALRRLRAAHDAPDLCRPPHRRRQAARGVGPARTPARPRRRALRKADAPAAAAPAALTRVAPPRRVTSG
jgi:SAM-dependent methyltransferase